jgi:hypothetical protein
MCIKIMITTQYSLGGRLGRDRMLVSSYPTSGISHATLFKHPIIRGNGEGVDC